MRRIDRLYVPHNITLEDLTTQLDGLGLLGSEAGHNAIKRLKNKLEERCKRQQVGRYEMSDVAVMLADQTEQDADFWLIQIRSAWRDGLLKFWLPDGTPCDYQDRPDAPRPMEYYLGLDSEYTTAQAVDEWLDAWGAKYRLPDGGEPVELKGQTQDRLILEQIKALGYDSQALPKQERGKAGVKKEVRDELDNKEPFEARTAFNQSWKRLRKYGDIKE